MRSGEIMTNPNPPREKINALLSLLDQKKWDAVIQESQQLIKKYPDAFIIWNILGIAVIRTGNTAKARACFQKAIQIKPNYAGAHNNLGVALRETGELDAAIDAHKKALTLKSDYADAYLQMAIALKMKEKIPEAIDAQRRAISIRPSFSNSEILPIKTINFRPTQLSNDTYSTFTPQDSKLYNLLAVKGSYSLELDTKIHKCPTNYRVRKAKILGQSNLILNDKSQFCVENIIFSAASTDKIFHTGENAFFDFDALKYYYKNEISIESAIFIGSHWNFGHWIFNHLCRLFYVDTATWENSKLVVSASLSKNYLDTLIEIGVPAKNIFMVSSGQILNVEHLIIPQMPWISNKDGLFVDPGIFPWLRKLLNVNVKTTGIKDKKIFITRANTKHRRVTNEKELFKIAEGFGFILVDIGNLSVREQLLLGKETSHIISPIGANSSFFLFAPDTTKMLEMTPPEKRMNVMGAFSRASNIVYDQIIGTPCEQTSTEILDGDYYIDPTEFRKMLQILIN